MSGEEKIRDASKRIILPLDVPDALMAVSVVRDLKGLVGVWKIGLELFCAKNGGHRVVEQIQDLDPEAGIMLDLKLHDIPATMAGAVRNVKALKPRFLTVHAASGAGHLAACVDAAGPDIGILGVTVLTSMSPEDFLESGGYGAIPDCVLTRANMAARAGCAGIVCSPHELSKLSSPAVSELQKIVPGVRPDWADANDQRRVMTPLEAMRFGATYVVIGRPILKPPKSMFPKEAARLVAKEIASFFS